MVSKNISIILFGLIITGLSGLFIDQPVSLWFSLPETEPYRTFAFSITDIGLGEHWFLLSILVFITSWIILKTKGPSDFKDKALILNLKNWSAHFFFALCTSGLILQITKHLIGRQRPHMSASREPFIFHPFTNHWDWHSFPSGHTQTLFCVATMIGYLWPRQRIFFWLAATLLAFTRVMSVQHFLSDTIGGAIIGILGTQLSLFLFRRKFPQPTKFS